MVAKMHYELRSFRKRTHQLDSLELLDHAPIPPRTGSSVGAYKAQIIATITMVEATVFLLNPQPALTRVHVMRVRARLGIGFLPQKTKSFSFQDLKLTVSVLISIVAAPFSTFWGLCIEIIRMLEFDAAARGTPRALWRLSIFCCANIWFAYSSLDRWSLYVIYFISKVLSHLSRA